MQKLIKNNWERKLGEPYEKIKILNHEIHPEGLDIDRVRFCEIGNLKPKAKVGHIISVLKGSGTLHVAGDDRSPFVLTAGVHLYLPPGTVSVLNGWPGAELVCVSVPIEPMGSLPSKAMGVMMFSKSSLV